MADRTLTQGDTWPPLKGLAADADGPMPIALAESLKVLLKSDTHLIEGAAEVIDPPEFDGDDTWNWQYVWEAGDTDNLGSYEPELEITWDSTTTPPRVETVPSKEAGVDRVVIEEKNT